MTVEELLQRLNYLIEKNPDAVKYNVLFASQTLFNSRLHDVNYGMICERVDGEMVLVLSATRIEL